MIVTCLYLMAVSVSVETAHDVRFPKTAVNPVPRSALTYVV